jgi:hypothetical protein
MIIHTGLEVNLCVKETVEFLFILNKMFLKIQFVYQPESIQYLAFEKINGEIDRIGLKKVNSIIQKLVRGKKWKNWQSV